MKHFNFSGIFLAFFILCITLQGCVDECKDVLCQNGGICINGLCDCPPGYSGQFCEVAPDLCAEVVCQNGGTCADGVCACPTGYGGTFCETLLDPCVEVTCQNGGTCEDGICDCPVGYGGEFCEDWWVEDYLGVWEAYSDCESGSFVYEVFIFASANTDNQFLINGFGGFNDPQIAVRAVALDKDIFKLVSGVDYPGVSITAITAGRINLATTPFTMSIEYAASVDGSGVTDECTLILTKL